MRKSLHILAIFCAALTVVTSDLSLVADPLSYTWLQGSYGADSTAQILGSSYDSDDSYAFDGSFEVSDHFFVTGRYSKDNYDLSGTDDLTIHETAFGLGYRTAIYEGDLPLDFFTILSYEHNRTISDRSLQEQTLQSDGGGLKIGLRGRVSKNLILFVDGFQQAYGTRFWHRDGDVDGFSMELGGEISISSQLSITAVYQTGETDYVTLSAFPNARQVEVDRDILRIGAKFYF